MRFLAIDTEATSLYLIHGGRPFALSACSNVGKEYYWDTPVDPYSREVKWPSVKLKEIAELILSYETIVFHNICFDLKSIYYLFSSVPTLQKKVFAHLKRLCLNLELHCTMIRTHVLDSKSFKGLKELALLHLDILDDDEKQLDKDIKHLRLIVKKDPFNWTIAEKGHPHMAGHKDSFHKSDMWIPKAYAQKMKLPFSHQYHDVCEIYARKDALRTAGLFLVQQNTFDSTESELQSPYRVQQRTIWPILMMEMEGISLLPEKFAEEKIFADEELLYLGQRLVNILNTNFGIQKFNPNSHTQLKDVVYNKFRFKCTNFTDKGNPSTDKQALPKLLEQNKTFAAKNFVKVLLQYAEIKSVVTYLQSYSEFQLHSVLYPNLNIVGTSTTRLSSNNPNGQNIGKGKEIDGYDEDGNEIKVVKHSIRKVFGPDEDHNWLAIDYEQLQIRIFAYWSQEQSLINAIEQGFDFHDFVARNVFSTDSPTKLQRRVAKAINFGILFGAGKTKINATAGISGIYEHMLELFPNVKEKLLEATSQVKQYGYIHTASGYRLTVPRNKGYAGVCYYVQGTEGDIVKKAIADTYEVIDDHPSYTLMMLQVHDELLFKFPIYSRPPLRRMLQVMEDAGAFYGVPCKCKPELITYQSSWANPIAISKDHFDAPRTLERPKRRRASTLIH